MMVEERAATGSGGGRVPARCVRAPNATFDRSFAIYTCNQRDVRCPFHGPTYVLDAEGPHFECRKRAEQ
jgi:hypothetical protein